MFFLSFHNYCCDFFSFFSGGHFYLVSLGFLALLEYDDGASASSGQGEGKVLPVKDEGHVVLAFGRFGPINVLGCSGTAFSVVHIKASSC